MNVVVHTAGDVMARFLVHVEESRASIALIAAVLEGTGSSPSDGASLRVSSRGTGVGVVEGWRGATIHRVEVDSAGVLSRVKVVDPSFYNRPTLPAALTHTIVPEFPLANKSFNLSYAGNDL